MIDVWESRERFEQYAADTIIPATVAAGIAGQPRIEFSEVHNYVTAA